MTDRLACVLFEVNWTLFWSGYFLDLVSGATMVVIGLVEKKGEESEYLRVSSAEAPAAVFGGINAHVGPASASAAATTTARM